MFQETKDLQVTGPTTHPCLDGWRKEVKIARLNGEFTDRQCKMANVWECCAVGEACGKYPYVVLYGPNQKYSTASPMDRKLEILGLNFSDAVLSHEFDECDDILNKIEHRLNELVQTQCLL